MTRHTLRRGYLSVTFLFVTISAVILGIRATGSIPTYTGPPTTPTERVTPAERGEVQAYPGRLISTPTEPAVTHKTRQRDGLAILESHCTQCHQPEWILQVEKPRTAWEKTLELMGAMGVHLDDSEKDILLNYLAIADNS